MPSEQVGRSVASYWLVQPNGRRRFTTRKEAERIAALVSTICEVEVVAYNEGREIMGIDWMNRAEMGEAIPPCYAAHVGGYLMAEIRRRKARVAA